jgi:hypothetical protein
VNPLRSLREKSNAVAQVIRPAPEYPLRSLREKVTQRHRSGDLRLRTGWEQKEKSAQSFNQRNQRFRQKCSRFHSSMVQGSKSAKNSNAAAQVRRPAPVNPLRSLREKSNAAAQVMRPAPVNPLRSLREKVILQHRSGDLRLITFIKYTYKAWRKAHGPILALSP